MHTFRKNEGHKRFCNYKVMKSLVSTYYHLILDFFIGFLSQMCKSKVKVLELDSHTIKSKEQKTKPDFRDVTIQTKPDCQKVAVQTKPACQEVAVQTKPDHQEVAVQTKSDCQEVVVQTKPDCQEVAIQMFSGGTADEITSRQSANIVTWLLYLLFHVVLSLVFSRLHLWSGSDWECRIHSS